MLAIRPILWAQLALDDHAPTWQTTVVTTTLDLPEPLYTRAVKAAAQRKLTLAGLVTAALQRELGGEMSERRRMEAPPVTTGGPVLALTNAQAALLFEEEELAKAR